jgi:hypothetical protein
MNALVSLKWIMLVYDQKLTHSFTNEWHKKIDSFTKMICPIQKWQDVTKMTEQIAGQFASRTELPFPHNAAPRINSKISAP